MPKRVSRTEGETEGGQGSQTAGSIYFKFGGRRVRLYKRKELSGGSSWFLCVYLREEKRQYRKSLGTTDRREAQAKAEEEIIDLLGRVRAGEKILSLSLADLRTQFGKEQEARLARKEIAQTTFVMQRYRAELGCEFLRSKLPAGMQTKLSAIDGKIFHGYRDWRLQKAASAGRTIGTNVVRDELLIIRKMFEYGRKQKLCSLASLPEWEFVVAKKNEVKRPRIEPQEFGRFIECVKVWERELRNGTAQQRYIRCLLRHYVLVMSHTGMRSGEMGSTPFPRTVW